MAKSLIYLPDISGFTNFVNNTEINHAQHIISELLEVIIDMNELEMIVSEIEGDAVLFYKHEEVPILKALIRQTEKIFVAFHEHIKKYDLDRVCQCGACSTASSLSLKVIAHAGEIGFTKVKDQLKPFGPPLVAAHRLSKNDIPEHEYLLLTHSIEFDQSADTALGPLIKGTNKYDGTDIDYQYVLLTGLRDKVPDPPPPPKPHRIPNPLTAEIYIDKPLFFVFEMVNNLDLRLLWRDDLNGLEYEEGKLNRVGTRHRCLFNRGFADFETVVDDFGEDALVYGERILTIPLVEEMAIFYIVTPSGEGTKVTIEAHYKMKPILRWAFLPILRKRIKRNIFNTLVELKKVCESTEEIEYSVL